MPFSLYAVLVAAFLPILAAFPAKVARDFSNARPRDPEFWASGFRARAFGAMQNGYEAFPLFAAAVLTALTQGGDPVTVDWLAGAFILARIGYVVAYWADKATLRSAVWTVGFGLSIAIFLTPLWAGTAGP